VGGAGAGGTVRMEVGEAAAAVGVAGGTVRMEVEGAPPRAQVVTSGLVELSELRNCYLWLFY
jgi:hypothetical protein